MYVCNLNKLCPTPTPTLGLTISPITAQRPTATDHRRQTTPRSRRPTRSWPGRPGTTPNVRRSVTGFVGDASAMRPGARCRMQIQDRSRRATNNRRILTRPVLTVATGLGFATRPWRPASDAPLRRHASGQIRLLVVTGFSSTTCRDSVTRGSTDRSATPADFRRASATPPRYGDSATRQQ